MARVVVIYKIFKGAAATHAHLWKHLCLKQLHFILKRTFPH